MVCRCGYQNEPDDFYCAQCGRKLSKRNGKGWIIAIVAVLLVAALAVGAWFLFFRDTSEKEPPKESEEVTETDPEPTETADPNEVKDDEAEEDLLNGWDEEGKYYYQDGEMLKGQQTIDGEYYYFSEETGEMLTGWQNIGDSWYYYTAEGPALGEGWYEDSKGWFYLEKDGKHCTVSPLTLGEATFTLDADGYLVSTVYASVICTTETATVDGMEQEVLKLPGQVIGCTKLNFTSREGTKIETMAGNVWTVWVRKDGEWIKLVQNTDFTVGEGEVSMLTFTKPVDMDAILISDGPNVKIGFMFTNVVCTK